MPTAVIRNIHLTRLSDLSWSADGRVLIVASTDGYCSVITFADQELGIPVDEILPVSLDSFPIPPPPPVKEKPTKEKKKKEPKKKQVQETKEKKVPKKKKGKEAVADKVEDQPAESPGKC